MNIFIFIFNFGMQSYRRTSIYPRTLKHWGMLRRSRHVLFFFQTYSTVVVAGVLDLFIVLKSASMSGIGSLELDSTSRFFVQGTKYCHR